MDERDPRAGDSYLVETPERIDLEYAVASLGSRFVAALADTFVLFVLVTLVGFLGTLGVAFALGAATALLGIGPSSVAGWAFAAILVLMFALLWGYYLFFELVWHGQSPGKRWLGLRVIKEGGYPIGFVDSAIRNLVRWVDFLPAFYMLGTLVMLVDRRSRRLGDLAAGTLVVKERRDLRLSALEAGLPPTSEAPPADSLESLAEDSIPNLHRLTPSDQSLLREYLQRRSTLAQPAAEALAAHLAAGFAHKLEHDLAGERPEAFLDRLARALAHRR